jgi:predicted AAA+ superfamily ATPase
MAEIARNNTGLSGEYFVAAELYRRGWSVGMTIGNAKAVDLFAEKDERIIAIQVKSIYKKKNVGWPMMKDKIKKDCFYIFVNLNADKMEMPDYYICTWEEA